jgi:DNA gyrase/topoisomerase IV subunit A
MAMRDKLHNTERQLLNAGKALNNELQNENNRLQIAQSELDQAKLVLEGKRQELSRIRAEAFDRITGSHLAGVIGDHPPHYEGGALNEQPPAYGTQENTATVASTGKS